MKLSSHFRIELREELNGNLFQNIFSSFFKLREEAFYSISFAEDLVYILALLSVEPKNTKGILSPTISGLFLQYLSIFQNVCFNPTLPSETHIANSGICIYLIKRKSAHSPSLITASSIATLLLFRLIYHFSNLKIALTYTLKF